MAATKSPTKKKKPERVPARTLRARVSDAGLLASVDKLMKETGYTEADLIREALREYGDRERLRDDLASIRESVGMTLNRLIKQQNTMRAEITVLVAFMERFSALYLFNTPEPPAEIRDAAAADAERRHKILLRHVAESFQSGNLLDAIATEEAESRE
jgi:hypothetical protein